MRKFTRGAAPGFLAEKWEAWGVAWEQRRAVSPGAAFNWRQHQNQPVNHLLLVPLKAQTQDHCSFCDQFPITPPGVDTIEHFRPKSRYPREAYRWENLYYCCPFCQGKSDDHDEAVLQPDALDYEFERYFRWDHTLGTLEINERASAEDQHRARVTRDLYHLNEEHPKLRQRELRRRAKDPEEPLDDFAYRCYIEP